MSKPQSEAPIKFASAQVVKALFVQSVKTKEETSTIAGKFGERIKTQVENGNLHNAAFNQAAAIFRKGRNNEIKAKEHLSHLKFYIELLEEDWENKGHVGNLDDQAKQAAAAPEPQGAAAAAEALFKKQDEETEATRTAAREALDLPADGSAAAPPPADAVEKPKRGRKGKAVEPAEEAAPPPPPAAVPTLADDDDEDIRPGFLKAKDAERKAAAVH